MTRKTITLPADIFDALELSAYAHGGIGAGLVSVGDAPFCLIGHVKEVLDAESSYYGAGYLTLVALQDRGLDYRVNDHIVHNINARKRRPHHTRVTWRQYIAEGNIVRGDV
jgi:hypothetical protein